MATQERTGLSSKISADKFLKWMADYNPTRAWFAKNNVTYERALGEISMVAEVEAAIIARKNAVLGGGWSISGKNQGHADAARANINAVGAHRIFNAVFDAVWYGFAVLDIPLIKQGANWAYQDVVSLPAHWFSFEGGALVYGTQKTPVLLTQGDLGKEAELVRYMPSYSNPYGESQLARVFWPATWLKGGFEYWASYISRFGDDAIIAHTDGGDPDKKGRILQDILNFRSSGGMVVEGTDTFELLKTEKTSSSLLFRDFTLSCRESISRLLLGHASALDSTPGKLGGEQNITLVREDIAAGDKRLIEDAVNSLIAHLAKINKWGEAPMFSFNPESENESALITRDKELYAMGLRFSPDYFAKNYRLSRSDFTIQETLQGIPAFADPNTAPEGEKELSAFDEAIEGRFNSIERPFKAYNKALIKALGEAQYWEDAYAALLQAPLIPPADRMLLTLLQANAAGRAQVKQRVAKLTQSPSFAEAEVLPPYFDSTETARNWFTKQAALSPEEYYSLEKNLCQYAFTVSGLAKTQHIAELADKLRQAYDGGQSYREFKKSLEPMAEAIEGISGRRLRLVFTQNTFSAYSEGRYKQMMQASALLPNWEYYTAGDDRVRPSHAALNGMVRRYDDAIWQTYYPPNGFNCRCVVLVTTKPVSGGSAPLTPIDEAFAGNPAAYDYFIGGKLKDSYTSLADWQRALRAAGQDKRVSLIGDKQRIALSGAGRSLPLFDEVGLNTLRAQAQEGLKAQGREYLTLFDKSGSPVFIGKDMISHILGEGFEKPRNPADAVARLRYFKSIETLITEADACVEDIVRYADSGDTVFQRYYYTRANNKTISVIVQWLRKDEGNTVSSIPAGATLMIQRGGISQTGVRIF